MAKRLPHPVAHTLEALINAYQLLVDMLERGEIGGSASSPLTTKGDIYVHSTVDTRQPIGTDTFVLTADSSQATGMKWAAGGTFTPTGTGFGHVTAGVWDAAAKLVDTADINNDQVDNTKLANMTSQRIKGRTTAGIGDPEDMTPAQVNTMLGTTVPTGTGFGHVTAGAWDAASKLVDTADVNNDQITYAKIQNVVTNNRVLGRVSGAGGDIEELTGSQVTGLLSLFTNLSSGIVPGSGGGTTNFLRADGSWAAPPGGGGAPDWTAFSQDLGAARRSGSFDLTGLSGITPDLLYLGVQTSAPISSKGSAQDEPEMDMIELVGIGIDSSTIRWRWWAPSVVVGTYNFAYGATS